LLDESKIIFLLNLTEALHILPLNSLKYEMSL